LSAEEGRMFVCVLKNHWTRLLASINLSMINSSFRNPRFHDTVASSLPTIFSHLPFLQLQSSVSVLRDAE
jgi:hypothetical protein